MSEGTTAAEETLATPGIPVEDEVHQQGPSHKEVESSQSSSGSEADEDPAGSPHELDEETQPPVSGTEPPLKRPPEPLPLRPGLLPRQDRPVRPEVRYYNYEGFMNRLQDDGEDFVIEALVTKPEWRPEVATEQAKRSVPPLPFPSSMPHRPPQPMPPPQPYGVAPPPPPPQPYAVAPPPPPPPPRQNIVRPLSKAQELKYPAVREIDGSQEHAFQAQLRLPGGSKVPPDGRIMRVRVRSEAVLSTLVSVAGFPCLAGETSFEFERPFRLMEETYEGMKSKLTEMGNQASNTEAPDEAQMLSSINNSQTHQAMPVGIGLRKAPLVGAKTEVFLPANPVTGSSRLRKKAEEQCDLEHMSCYVKFIETMVLPIRNNFLSFSETKNPRVCFQDILYLFKPGSLAYLPNKRKSGKSLHRSAAQQVWRMVSCRPATVWTRGYSEESEDPYEHTRWSIYCLDYDGDTIVPVWNVIKFERFDGERDITSLECYPLDFHPNKKDIIDKHQSIGHMFNSCISAKLKHHYYSGWTFITGLHAEPLDDENGNQVQYPEYIESDVVIDFKETLRSYPKWETDVGDAYPLSSDQEWETYSEFPLSVWGKDVDATIGRRRYRDEDIPILTEEFIYYRDEAEKWMAKDEFLLKDVEFLRKTWSDVDLALLPKRLFAYILRERKFARIDVEGIELNTGESNVNLNQIQMKPERRRMIRSAVSAHFRDNKGSSTFDLDLIKGKGRGLVILLHGAPGVGKTATAEAVAAETRRPLFPITCGDLGFSPNAVDKSLRDIFRYAHLWNCILLLDEADVFLTQRDRGGGNLERNALVGVFLKVLEYYSGILFLTTNRVGALDEAFQSRVHLSLSYPNLSLEDTVKILEANLSRLPRVERAENNTPRDGYLKVNDKAIIEFVSSEYKRYAERTGKDRGPWNGRQIRNAVQIAAGLALYDKQTELEEKGEDGIPAFLTTDHFRAVAETTSEFEQYLEETNVGDNETRAKRRQDRADHFKVKREHDDGDSDVEKRNNPPRARYRGSSPETEHTRSGEHASGQRSSGTPRRNRQPPPQHSSMSAREYVATASFDRETGRGQPRSHGGQTPRRPRENYYEDEHYDQAEDSQEYWQEDALEDEEYDRGHRPRVMSRRGKPESSLVGRGKY